MHILLIEDNTKLINNITEYFGFENINLDTATNGEEGCHKILNNTYNAIILDIGLPKLSGFEVCDLVRKDDIQTPILFLTAFRGKNNIIEGFRVGADDYLTKPFDMDILIARLKALIKRNPQKQTHITINDIDINLQNHEIRKNSKTITLSPREYELLKYLLDHRGVVQSHDAIIEHVWGEYDRLLFSRTVDVHVSYLRKKLGKDVITTVKGNGYFIP